MRLIEPDQLPWDEIGLKIDQEYVRPMLDSLPVEQVATRLKPFKSWTAEISISCGLPITLTPVIARFLARQGDYEAQLIELDRLVEKTRNGHFELADEVQRDLEYGRLPEGDRKG